MAQYKIWKLQDLKEGIDRFYKENGRFPTVNDVDQINYLPSARWIQMKFGGMVEVRKVLGYQDVHLGAGAYRTEIAKKVNQEGLKYEHEIESFLINKFGEPFVHVQKRVGTKRARLDFYVYSVSKNFGVDVTSVTGSFRNLQTNINVKIPKYGDLQIELFIVVNGDFNQDQFDAWSAKKINSLPHGWKIFTTTNFIRYVDQFRPYSLSEKPSYDKR